MPALSARGSASSVSFVKFSDRLTVSLNDITRMIQEHKEMIDSIQEVALELTGTIGTLHTLTVKYAGIANSILDGLLPIAKGLPVIPKQITNLLANLEAITQKIIDNSASTSKTISDVNSGLRTGDVSKLKGHTADLKKVTQTLNSILPK
jgi:methyl-accepting chemotaxis protein